MPRPRPVVHADLRRAVPRLPARQPDLSMQGPDMNADALYFLVAPAEDLSRAPLLQPISPGGTRSGRQPADAGRSGHVIIRAGLQRGDPVTFIVTVGYRDDWQRGAAVFRLLDQRRHIGRVCLGVSPGEVCRPAPDPVERRGIRFRIGDATMFTNQAGREGTWDRGLVTHHQTARRVAGHFTTVLRPLVFIQSADQHWSLPQVR